MLYGFIHKYRDYLILAAVSLILLIPLFWGGFYQSHDGPAHVARIPQYLKAFQHGQFPPRWAPTLNYGYGSPVFIIFYPLGGYLGALGHVLGLSYETSFSAVISLFFVLGPLLFYLWVS